MSLSVLPTREQESLDESTLDLPILSNSPPIDGEYYPSDRLEPPQSLETTRNRKPSMTSISAAGESEPRSSQTLFAMADFPSPNPVARVSPTNVLRPTTLRSLVEVVRASYLNVLLLFIPIGWAVHFANVNPAIVFFCTFVAIIPLAKLLAFTTEELAIRVGDTLGGLVNATLGNAVELIVAIIALTQCKFTIVQSSLVGSILSNLLLVLGMCFFAGGTRYAEQAFSVKPAQLNSTLLVLSVIAVLLPGAFHSAIQSSNNSDYNSADDYPVSLQRTDILHMSRGVAVILLVIYVSYLAFTLWSHVEVMNEKSGERTATEYSTRVKNTYQSLTYLGHHSKETLPTRSSDVGSNAERGVIRTSTEQSRLSDGNAAVIVEESKLNLPVTVAVLIVVTVLVGVSAEFLVSSIDGLTATGAVSEEFVGLILLPIVGNAAEHVTAVTVSVKNKLDLSISVAVGSSIQIALFVIPFIVVLAWMMGKPLTMLFDPFESIVMFLAVLTVNHCVQDGKSNWLEGMILMNLYVIVGVCFWFYPGFNPTVMLGLSC